MAFASTVYVFFIIRASAVYGNSWIVVGFLGTLASLILVLQGIASPDFGVVPWATGHGPCFAGKTPTSSHMLVIFWVSPKICTYPPWVTSWPKRLGRRGKQASRALITHYTCLAPRPACLQGALLPVRARLNKVLTSLLKQLGPFIFDTITTVMLLARIAVIRKRGGVHSSIVRLLA
jgi:hypothetical protein